MNTIVSSLRTELYFGALELALFELNTEELQYRISTYLTELLADAKEMKIIKDFAPVKCDEQLNTLEVIENHQVQLAISVLVEEDFNCFVYGWYFGVGTDGFIVEHRTNITTNSTSVEEMFV